MKKRHPLSILAAIPMDVVVVIVRAVVQIVLALFGRGRGGSGPP